MTPSPTTHVLDASALLALFWEEPGTLQVRTAIRSGALISSVNYAEVLTRLADRGEDPVDLHRRFRDGELIEHYVEVVPFTDELSVAAAALREPTRHLGLSLGDRACLATTLRVGAPVLTADRAWAELDLGVEIRLIR